MPNREELLKEFTKLVKRLEQMNPSDRKRLLKMTVDFFAEEDRNPTAGDGDASERDGNGTGDPDAGAEPPAEA